MIGLKWIGFEINYEVVLDTILKILIIIASSIIIYYFFRLIIKRIFSIGLKAKKFRLKDPEFFRKRQQTLEKILLSIWRYFVYAITFLLILTALGVNVQTIIAGAGVLGLIFAVGSQKLIQDFVDGFFNIFEDNISVGDYVEIDGISGDIVDIGLRNIKIKSWSGEIHIIPNSKIGHFINYSMDHGKAIVDVKIDYNVEIDHVMQLITNHAQALKDGNSDILSVPVISGINKFDTIGYDIRVSCVTAKETHWGVQRYIRRELLKLFKDHGIEIGMNQIIIKENNPKA